ncbi:tRNA (cytidine(34)-2'-O)-methyltransferase [Helicobacter muridarum]|uniref:Putative tRNA (cytidine(34)-2'-O)-methyltransferase n=1 Tax=Helicobacter muridarum TaxID=216 RepID=A0A4U8TK85_9HELI|nr:tRNA (cytidine(34)-2'-O)-methyltransferase [Helicobacter muridarum]
MSYNIVLVNPDIPQNTGNIARLCVGINACLHLIHPLGFSLESKFAKRAGLDYWDKLKLAEYKNINDFFTIFDSRNTTKSNEAIIYGNKKSLHFAFSSKSNSIYFNHDFFAKQKLCSLGEHFCYFLYFGSETNGLSSLFESYFADINGVYLTIPMSDDCRCLNLSNAVSIASYELIRQSHLYVVNYYNSNNV